MTINTYRLALGFIAAAAISHGAAAQQAGFYKGTSTDGSNIQFTIGTNSTTGNLQVTAVGISLSDSCNPGAFTYNTAWGLGGDGTDLAGNKGTYNFSYGYLYVSATLVFSGSTLKGTVENATPTLIEPSSGEPKKAAYCSAKRQAFTATLQAMTPATVASNPHALLYSAKIVRN